MPSTNKTPLGLNQWLLSDKPAMDDFNADNLIAEREIGRIDGELENMATKDGTLQVGLNAERLNGKYSEEFTKGTILDPIPISDYSDLNNFIYVGEHYNGFNEQIRNKPDSSTFFILTVKKFASYNDGVMQFYTSGTTAIQYRRSYYNGQWRTDWIE